MRFGDRRSSDNVEYREGGGGGFGGGGGGGMLGSVSVSNLSLWRSPAASYMLLSMEAVCIL